jgi:hypothetical protein
MNHDYNNYFNFGMEDPIRFSGPSEDFDFFFFSKEKEPTHFLFDSPELNSSDSPSTYENHEVMGSEYNGTINMINMTTPFTIGIF